MEQDQGTSTPDGGQTWPAWGNPVIEAPADAEMVTVRSDSVAFAGTAMRIGNVFRGPDGGLWQFALYVEGDSSQGGAMFPLIIARGEAPKP